MQRKSLVRTSVIGLLVLLTLTVACAKSQAPTAVPAPTAPAPTAPAATPAPSPSPAPSTPAPSAPAAAPAPSQAIPAPAAPATALDAFLARTEGQPLVPGGPPFFPKKLSQEKGIQILFRYHQTKLPLWEKANYGGELRVYTNWVSSVFMGLKDIQVLSRPSYAGMLLGFDMGRCSLVGREGRYNTCDGKYGNNQSLVIVPSIFERWGQPDPLTYVFNVRKGVLWPARPPMTRTDREVTAEDIVWFLQTTKNEGALKDNFQLVDKFEALDRYTVRVSMKSPHFEFLRHMANSSMGIYPRECYEEKGCLGSVKVPTPGPFLLNQSETIERQRMVFERNPEFHLKGLPYLDRWVGDAINDPAAQKAALFAGKVDFHIAWTETELIKSFQDKIPGLQAHAQGVLAGTSVLRPQLKGPLADVRVRRAMAMAMNHRFIWDAAQEGFYYFPNIVSRDYFGADWFFTLEQAGQWYQFNPEKAKQLMAEAGYSKGFTMQLPITFSSGGPYEAMLALQSQWKQHLGIDLQIKIIDTVAYNSQLYGKTWEGGIYQYGWNISYWAEGETALSHFTKGQRLNLQGVDDQWVSDLYPKVRSELDAAKRTALLWEFEQYELDHVYLFRIAPPTSFNLFQPWIMNAAAHQVAWHTAVNGPTWLTMLDTAKTPKR